MPIVFDTSALILAIDAGKSAPIDPSTGQVVADIRERYNYLLSGLARSRTKICIPTPVLSELMVRAEDAASTYAELLGRPPFELATFDKRSAIECADLLRSFGARSVRKFAGTSDPRAKLNFDRQIVAIARVHGATAIYSDDAHIAKLGEHVSIQVIRTWELPLDPASRQQNLDFAASPTDQ